MVSRRALLLGLPAGGVAAAAVAFAGVDAGALPGRAAMHRLLGWTGPDGVVPRIATGPVASGSFFSRRRGTTTGWSLMRPPGVTGTLPLVVALHGLGGDHTTFVEGLGGPQFLAQAVARGVPPFAIVSVDGGTGYWHPHAGTDAGAMVLDELLPRMAAHGIDTSRLGFYGWSMGGYGSLRLAPLAHARAVAVASPAIWVDSSGVSPSGFSSAAEYDRYSVFGRQADLAGIGVRVDIGRDDPFFVAVRRYVAGFPRSAHVAHTFPEGAHNAGFWTRMLPAELSFLGRRLAA